MIDDILLGLGIIGILGFMLDYYSVRKTVLSLEQRIRQLEYEQRTRYR